MYKNLLTGATVMNKTEIVPRFTELIVRLGDRQARHNSGLVIKA